MIERPDLPERVAERLVGGSRAALYLAIAEAILRREDAEAAEVAERRATMRLVERKPEEDPDATA